MTPLAWAARPPRPLPTRSASQANTWNRDPEACQSSAEGIRCPNREAGGPKGARCQQLLMSTAQATPTSVSGAQVLGDLSDAAQVFEAIRGYLWDLEKANEQMAQCFGLRDFRERLLNFLENDAYLKVRIVDSIPGGHSGYYHCLWKTLDVLRSIMEKGSTGDLITLVHEALHAYANRFDLFGMCGLTSEADDESWTGAMEALLGEYDSWSREPARLNALPAGSKDCDELETRIGSSRLPISSRRAFRDS